MNTTRRQFLSTALGSSAVISLSSSAPRFLLEAAERESQNKGESILVVLQLSGGNDGLNTVIPYADDAYHKNRPKLRIAPDDVLNINDSTGFHPAMQGFSDLLEAGKLSIVQGVGYANPNRSHFESMDIWHTCRHKDETRSDGWLGRFLDGSAIKGGDVPAIHLGAEKQPLALAAQSVRTPSIHSLERFRLRAGDNKQLGKDIQTITAADRIGKNDLLGFVQTSTTSALSASRRVEQAAAGYKTEINYPDSGLAQKLKTVAQLIDAGLQTRIYYVTLGGFDTHSQQTDAHRALMGEMSGAVSAFVQDIAAHDHGKRVLLMAFSEFGRRVKENASEGTDHGAAAPMFLAGEAVKPGLVGDQPSLTDLSDGDLKFHTDFRQVYATILDQWLHWNSRPILGKQYQSVDCLKT
ncbi:MAG: hypothetical protein COA78_17825 [Blastopirellula sp.]|nr:MAG: hypothetical protein COA78_17825 [Blastopirellula sp.]